jgi:hypothetical protein
MANLKHLKVLLKGVEGWNKWRREKPDILPDLSGANLSGAYLWWADLRGANLSKTNLSQAQLGSANLGGANLSGANLRRANLSDSHLSSANLIEANLNDADLSRADLSRAHLRKASLRRVNLTDTNLSDADLSRVDLSRACLNAASLGAADLREAVFLRTVMADLNLSEVEGLESVIHSGPSAIGIDTLLNSKGKIPALFLRGAGVPETFLQQAQALGERSLEFYSCFISYNHVDRAFARRLHDGLQELGIRCWLDEKKLLPREQIHRAVDEAVRLRDKILLCCSKTALTSWWLDKEIEKSLLKEEQLYKERGKDVRALIPLNLDNYVYDPRWQDWKKPHLTTRRPADFTGWERDPEKFKAQFESVVGALRLEEG